MARTYKVWAYIERYDDAADEYEDLGSPVPIGEFATLQEANAFMIQHSLDGEGAVNDDDTDDDVPVVVVPAKDVQVGATVRSPYGDPALVTDVEVHDDDTVTLHLQGGRRWQAPEYVTVIPNA